MGVPEIAQKVPDRALCLAYLALPEGGGAPPAPGVGDRGPSSVGVVLWIMVLLTVILARERTRKNYSGWAPGGGLSGGVGLNRAGGGPPP